MTDRQERFDLKISKLKLLRKQRRLHLGCPWGKLKHTKIHFKVNYPFNPKINSGNGHGLCDYRSRVSKFVWPLAVYALCSQQIALKTLK